MRAQKRFFLAIGALAVAMLLLLGWQQRTALVLRHELALRRTEAAERSRLQAEARRLSAAQVADVEMERLRAERNAVSALRAEIETMRRRAEANARPATAEGAPKMAGKNRVDRPMTEAAVPAALWKNAGRATPAAALETILWAAAGGDMATLEKGLAVDLDVGLKAEAIFRKLPAAMQRELVSPQGLIALLTAKDVPLGSAQILAQDQTPTDVKVAVHLLDEQGKMKYVLLSYRADGPKWRLVVPASAVDNYAAVLSAPVAAQ